MQINEVEQQIGITKKNIRFYEKEGLLTPGRLAGNGYRTYTQEDVQRLAQIKLLRKLDVSLEDIRNMLQSEQPLAQGMQQHLTALEQRKQNLESAIALSTGLAKEAAPLAQLNATEYLQHMETLEQKGVRFINIQKQDKAKRYRGAALAAFVFVLLMGLMEGFLIWAICSEPLPFFPALFILATPLVFIVGVLLALWDRLRAIGKGEEDDAAKY